MGLSVSVGAILNSRTLGNLATLVEMSSNPTLSTEEPSGVSQNGTAISSTYETQLQSILADKPGVEIEDAYPLSPIQREIMNQRAINPDIFVLKWEMDLYSRDSQPISLERLSRAWGRVVQRQPILRSIFLQDKSGEEPPLQVLLVGAQPEIALGLDDPLPALDDCFLPHRARFYLHEGKIMGSIELDHLVIDGWSFRLIKADLLAAYESDETLPEPPPYKAYINTLRPDRVETDEKYWTSMLRNQPPTLLSLPTSLPSHALEQSNFPTKTIIRLPGVDVKSMSNFSAQNGLTIASIFGAAWAQTLAVYTQSTDVTFEYVVSGRDQDIPGVFDIVGPLMNVLANYLYNVSTENSSTALIRLAHQIQDQRMQDGAHNSCNIREVVQNELGIPKLFNTGLNFQRRPTAVETGNLVVDDDLERSKDPWHVCPVRLHPLSFSF
jgi:hypothetical protein